MECCGEMKIMLGPLYFVELKPYPKHERFLQTSLMNHADYLF